jgi:phage shock protein PspC (stress-responsive transcriptional regulator)
MLLNIIINMGERNKILLLSVIVSAILTYLIAICILANTAPQHETQGTLTSEGMLMKKIAEGSMPGHKFFPLDILVVISSLFFVGLSMVFYVVIKHITERRK